MGFQSSLLLPACTAHRTPRPWENLGGQLCCRKRFPWVRMCLDPVCRSGKISFLVSSALCSLAVAVMSKAVSTDFSGGFSSLEWHPASQPPPQVSQWATKQQMESTNLLLLQSHCWLQSWEDLYHTSKLCKPVTSLHYMELYIPRTPLLLQEDLKHITKQHKWAGASSRFFWKRRGGSMWRSQPVPPVLARPSPCHRDHLLPCKWWNMVRNRIANIYWLLHCFPTEFWGVCLFIFNLIFKS